MSFFCKNEYSFSYFIQETTKLNHRQRSPLPRDPQKTPGNGDRPVYFLFYFFLYFLSLRH
ncbi:hypothetical protein [Oxynema aestuarii]|uniref:Uncharacterized protein n=1 Tax=Oxynema aestuarii AP17 TaxID=2064643 RepID=A0A6H1TTJ8_9CYAN|nr:hypothetical protein [Oxynema aestuarii]QIZ69871.1 hypothetical protein HCG48_04140 [Oxynema aestuarii AP17]